MLCSCQNGVSGNLPRLMPVIIVVSACVFLSAYARADAPDPVVDKSAAWVAGPTNVTLGEAIEVQVLPGYRLTDAAGEIGRAHV